MSLTPEIGGPENPSAKIPSADVFENMRKNAEERILADRERGGSNIPMEGEYFFKLLQDVEIGSDGDVSELVSAIEKSRAYQEGILRIKSPTLTDFDPNNASDPNTKHVLSYFRNLFLTVEGASERPNAPYVLIKEKTTIEDLEVRTEDWSEDKNLYRRRRLREFQRINESRLLNGVSLIEDERIAEIIRKDEEKLENELKAVKKLLAVSNHNKSREKIDYAFRQRMATCENPASAASLGGEIKAVSPDGNDYGNLFQTGEIKVGFNFGEEVDKSFEEILKFGMTRKRVLECGMSPIPDEIRNIVCGERERSVYAVGFKDATAFGNWIKYLLDKADGRIDVVWTAWRLFLSWEVSEKLAIDINSGDGKIQMGFPPIGNSLISQTSHLEWKRKVEFGVDANLKRTQIEKFISHSGLPLTIEELPNLCDDFLHETKIKIDTSYLTMNTAFSNKLLAALQNVSRRMPKEKTLDNAYEWDDDYAGEAQASSEIQYKTRKGTYNPAENTLANKIWKFLTREPKKDKDGRTIVDNRNRPIPAVKSVEISLWDLRVYGGLKFSDPNFPWLISDQPTTLTASPGAVPSGAFGAWLLTRSRSFAMLSNKDSSGIKDVVPKLEMLADPKHYLSNLRNYTKVWGKVSGEIASDQNPRAHLLLGWLDVFNPGPLDTETPARKSHPYARGFKSPDQEFVFSVSSNDPRKVTIVKILEAAISTGWIRPKDADWIQEQLGKKVYDFEVNYKKLEDRGVLPPTPAKK